MNTILGQFKIGEDQAKFGALVQCQLKIGERQAIFGGLFVMLTGITIAERVQKIIIKRRKAKADDEDGTISRHMKRVTV